MRECPVVPNDSDSMAVFFPPCFARILDGYNNPMQALHLTRERRAHNKYVTFHDLHTSTYMAIFEREYFFRFLAVILSGLIHSRRQATH